MITSKCMENTYNKVNPAYYPKTIFEPINIIEYYNLNYNLGSALVYILRWGKKTDKSDTTDLEKAIWYLKREIENTKNPFDYERLLKQHCNCIDKEKNRNSFNDEEDYELGAF